MNRRHHLPGYDPARKEIDHRQQVPSNSPHTELGPVTAPHLISLPDLVARALPRCRPPLIRLDLPVLFQLPVDHRRPTARFPAVAIPLGCADGDTADFAP